ncbi:peptidase M36, partial [Chytridium lagenaria]
ASYNVIPFGFSDPIDNGGRLTTLTNPADPLASRNGWHDFGLGAGSVSATQGNNIIASSNPQNARNALQNPRVAVQNFNFNFNLNPNVAATPNSQNSAAGVTNMFYVTNTFHDVLFHYGFDEPAGNFQVSNFGRGGRGNDPVIATAQDGSGVNNANFASPPDGTPGRMRMFLFTAANPDRDAALENDIIIHEIGHGVSTRLTGGPANSNCLRSSQSSGMGEGWSDFFGVLTQMKQEDTRNTDVGVGVFVTQRAAGVRRNPYKKSKHVRDIEDHKPRNPHAIGEVWNSMLYEVYWNMVDKEGFAPPSTLIAQRNSNRGNVNMMKLIIDSLKLQPCNPTLIQSRNAIVQADQVRFGGSHRCEIFRGFAKRGLGVNARDDGAFVNNFDVPQGC